MSRCWCKCEAGLGQCGPKLPRLKSLFSAHKHADDTSVRRGDRQAELQIIWEETGEEKRKKLEELRQLLLAAVDKVYDKALEESVRRRTALEESVLSSERRLGELLGPDSAKAFASSQLPLQTRLDMNMASLRELDSARLGNYGWVGGLVVMVELRRRVMMLRETLNLPPCDPSADLDKILGTTLEALGKLYPGKTTPLTSSDISGGQKPILQRLQRFYQALRAIENTWVESFAMKTPYSKRTGLCSRIGGALRDDEVGDCLNDQMERAAQLHLQNMEEKRNARKRTLAQRLKPEDPITRSTPSHNPTCKSLTSKNKITKSDYTGSDDNLNLEQLSQNIISKLDALNQHLKTSIENPQESPSQAQGSPRHSTSKPVLNTPWLTTSKPSTPSGKSPSVSRQSRESSPDMPSTSNQSAQSVLSRRFTPPHRLGNEFSFPAEPSHSTQNHIPREVTTTPRRSPSALKPENEVFNLVARGRSAHNSALQGTTSVLPSTLLPENMPLRTGGNSQEAQNPVNRAKVSTGPFPSNRTPDKISSHSPVSNQGSQNALNKEASTPRRCPPSPSARSQVQPSAPTSIADFSRANLPPGSGSVTQAERENLGVGQLKPGESVGPLNTLSKAPPSQSVAATPLRTITNSNGAVVNTLPRKSGPPPPPPPPPPLPSAGAGIALLRKQSKLKRSIKISKLYRSLKTVIEGAAHVQSSNGGPGSTNRRLSSSGSREGMAEALAEITKKSTYFQKIEDDVQQYAKPIEEAKTAVETFETADMEYLMSFHRKLETLLENLTDETQVLSRFKDFPSNKLETMRLAAALYSRLLTMAQELERWEVHSPASEHLDKVNRYFDKMKKELEVVESTKDEDFKRFASHKIKFDFAILVRIKEAMVGVSSRCLNLALEENKRSKAISRERGRCTPATYDANRQRQCSQMLWKAFQLAYRVYNFAGGHDDPSEKLIAEIACEIESYPPDVWT